MSFFKRKDKFAIPPIAEPPRNDAASVRSTTSSLPSYRSNASTYVASRDGELYNDNKYGNNDNSYNNDRYNNNKNNNNNGRSNNAASAPSDHFAHRDKYSRNNAVGDVYSRGDANLEQDRNELFAGYNPARQGEGSGRFFDGPQGRKEPTPGEENDEDVEGIKTQTRFVKQESVNSTRNALRMAREAEETARNTLGKLGDQSGSHAPNLFTIQNTR